MRIAVLSDIHGNLTAFEAVLEDLRSTSPDLILHGGDLADGGAHPIEIVDRIRELGWQGVVGNTDEMLFRPESLDEFAHPLPQLKAMFDAVREMAAATRQALGDDRLAWLSSLPRIQLHPPMALVHGSLGDLWRAPSPEAIDTELQSLYEPLGQQVAIYGHIHRPYIRTLASLVVANSGSVGLSYDGDRRAAYLLLDDSTPRIRRVEYDVDKECKALLASGLPHAGWVARMLETAGPQIP